MEFRIGQQVRWRGLNAVLTGRVERIATTATVTQSGETTSVSLLVRTNQGKYVNINERSIFNYGKEQRQNNDGPDVLP